MNEIKISTIGSHSALQILFGAKQEGLKTKLYCLKGRQKIYEQFAVTDQIVLLDSYTELLDKEPEKEEIFIPHGTLIATLKEKVLDISLPIFGNKLSMLWEMEREKNHRLLEKAGIRTPKSFKIDEIDRLCIVKFPGAKGGDGYFLCSTASEYEKKLTELITQGKIQEEETEGAQIQEYIAGVTMYPHYFHSIIYERVEMLGIDRRYETNVDALGRLSQEKTEITPSYKVVGNQPLIIRESLLPEIIEYGERLLKASKELFPPGLIGPYCLELALTPEETIAFEFTSRIVAGTSLYVSGSPYSTILFNEEMSMAKRIAREIKMAKEQERLEELIT
ncbi:MAG: formate--phosphoribosylaminoimidazolecarboxamide ligase [Candidatus Heimdallarchaeaceae archaeon]